MAENKEQTYGILVDYEFCTGCHTCEVACKRELNLGKGQYGIKVSEIEPFKIDDTHWEWTFIPALTQMCNMCEQRVAEGKIPTCVHHCSPGIMYYGTIEELSKKMTGKSRMALLVKPQ
jgi:Fe-S-cluster-containing dehydrogenase component